MVIFDTVKNWGQSITITVGQIINWLVLDKILLVLNNRSKRPWGLAQVAKGWGGFVGGSRKVPMGTKIYLSK